MTNLIQLRILIHLNDIVIFRLAKYKAFHRILYAITAGKVNASKICIGLTVLTQTKSKIKSLFAHDLGCYYNLDTKIYN